MCIRDRACAHSRAREGAHDDARQDLRADQGAGRTRRRAPGGLGLRVRAQREPQTRRGVARGRAHGADRPRARRCRRDHGGRRVDRGGPGERRIRRRTALRRRRRPDGRRRARRSQGAGAATAGDRGARHGRCARGRSPPPRRPRGGRLRRDGPDARLAGARGPAPAARAPRPRRRPAPRQRRPGDQAAAPARRRRRERRRARAWRQGPEAAERVLRRRRRRRLLRRSAGMTIESRFGPYGGRYVPETLIPALDELTGAYEEARADAAFQAELARLLADYAGRPTPLYHAARLSERCGATILLKREDLLHTGAHKINNVLGQALLAKRMGKTRVIAETGAGQHGVATATACALFDLECAIYMGAEDVRRQELNVVRMRLLGATVVPVESGSRTLKDAMNEALRDWVSNVGHTFYAIGTVAGPAPYPAMVRDFQAVIGAEAIAQVRERYGHLPDEVVACVGGGSNAMGVFHAFRHLPVRMTGVEAEGVEEP